MVGTRRSGSLASASWTSARRSTGTSGRDVAERARLADEVLLEDLEHGGRVALEAERVRARERLVEDDAHRVDVGPRVRGAGVELLRRHVERRAEEALVAGRGPALQLGDAEIDHLHHVGRGDQDVRRLEIAVDHALAVRLGDPLRGLVDPADHVLHGGERERIAELVAEGHALDHLEDEVEVIVLDPGLVEAHHVDVLDAHQGLGLAGQPGARRRRARRRRGEHLERAMAPRRVHRVVHLGEAACPEEALDAIAT